MPRGSGPGAGLAVVAVALVLGLVTSGWAVGAVRLTPSEPSGTSGGNARSLLEPGYGQGAVPGTAPDPVVGTLSLWNDTLLSGNASTIEPAGPVGLAVLGDGKVLVADSQSNSVSVFDPGTGRSTGVPLPAGAYQMAYDAADQRVFVSAPGPGHALTVLNATTLAVEGTIPAPSGSAAFAYDSGNGLLYLSAGSNDLTVVRAGTGATVDNLSIGTVGVLGLRYDAADGRLYLLEPAAGEVAVFDPSTGTVVTNLSIGHWVDDLTYDPSTDELYVLSSGGPTALENVTVFSGRTDAKLGAIQLPGAGLVETFDSATGALYVGGVDVVHILNGTSLATEATLTLDGYSAELDYDAVSGRVYVSLFDTACLAVIDGATRSLLATFPVGFSGSALAYDAGNDQLYLTLSNANAVLGIDATNGTILARIPTGEAPVAVALDPELGRLYVANSRSGNLTVIDTTTDSTVASIGVGVGPGAEAYDAVDHLLAVALAAPSEVVLVNASTDRVVGSVSTDSPLGALTGLAVDPASGRLYVADRPDGNVSVVDPTSGTVVATLHAPGNSTAVLYDARSSRLYLANSPPGATVFAPSGAVGVYAAGSGGLEAWVPADSGTDALALDPDGSFLFATNSVGNDVAVLNTTADFRLRQVPVGLGPDAAAFDPANGRLYVLDGASGAISILDRVAAELPVTYPVTFDETGLPPGTAWAVGFGSYLPAIHITTANSTSFGARNGSVEFYVNYLPGYSAYPESGSASVQGGRTIVNVTFTRNSTATSFWLTPGSLIVYGLAAAGVAGLGLAVRRARGHRRLRREFP